jgi:hypothetical protein
MIHEATKAFDANIFYIGKKIHFNFEESEGTFSPLLQHLSFIHFHTNVMKEIICFVQVQA